MTKVRFTCDWCDDISLSQRFIRCYASKSFKINFEITTHDDYDVLVSINKPVYRRDIGRKYIGVLMEPSWFLGEHKKNEIYKTCDHVISYTKNSPYKNNIYYPGILPFHLTYDTGPSLDHYLNNRFTKDRLCSIVVSRNKTSHNNNVLYNSRVNLVEEILQTNLPIDIYGKGWEDYTSRDSRIKGSLDIEEKYKGLESYKFSICIENCSEESYFTEKITDSILTNTIPIYYGCKSIEEFFSSPIVLSSIDGKKAIDQISNILKHEEDKEFPIKDKALIGNKFNLFVALTKLISHYNK